MTLLATAALFEGALFGRHASPFSNNTIVASIATAGDHADHARTQLGYAIVVMLVTLCIGYFPCGFLGWSPWLALAVGCGTLLMIVFVFGRKTGPTYKTLQP
jgi:Na+/H+ antiporter NhaC